MVMEFIKTDIDGVVVLQPKVFGDDRGYFLESFNQKEFEDNVGYKINFCQDNESKSSYGVLRGLHFQKTPYTQSKLVRVISGCVLDVVVDLREKSKTFGKSVSVELNDKNKKQLFVPRGFAHGFIVLSDTAIFSYKVDNYYAPKYEDGLMYNDAVLEIDWKVENSKILLSQKDKENSSLDSVYRFKGELYD
jgi:dTDP-4-dehydrorhamnose 3,5-epimerase